MSFYSDASLVMIPSGYKTSKVYSAVPTDGTGDLTFTRSNSTATRVGPDGLIEKVRTNLVTYSQDFSNAAWSKSAGTTLTHSQTDPNGGTTATRVVMTSGANNFFTQAISGSGTRFITLSVWVKGVTTGGTFSLNTGTAASRTGTTITYTTTWTRYDIIQNETTSNTGFQIDNYSDSVGQVAGDFLIAFAQVESSDFGPTPYIATTTAAVSVGPVANVPRLDYLNSSCPRLLLEGQRTNVFLNSESASLQTQTGTVTISSNSAISPSGYQDADQITADAGSYLRQTITTVVGQKFAFSIFLKNVNAETSSLFVRNTTTATRFDITWAGAVPTLTNLGPSATATAVSYGNGWYRIEIVAAAVETSTIFRIYPSVLASSGSVLFWGAQVETNVSYPSSYIPTLGAAVTRGADACSKTGISSLIGQTEGTLFIEFNNLQELDVPEITLDDTTNNNRIVIARNTVTAFWGIFTASAGTSGITFGTTTGNSGKFALAYSSAGYVLYRNGVQIATRTAALPVSLSAIRLNGRATNDLFGNKNVSQALLFKTRLTNAQLAELTA